MEGIEITYSRDGLAVACSSTMVITLIRGTVTSEFLTAASRAGQRTLRRHPEGFGSLTLLTAGTPIPEGRTREESARHTRESSAWLKGGATVVWGEGFAAATIRSVVIALTLLSRGPPRKIFATPAPALDWLATKVGTASREELTAVLAWSERALGDGYLELIGAQ